jgi:hypothetical protein
MLNFINVSPISTSTGVPSGSVSGQVEKAGPPDTLFLLASSISANSKLPFFNSPEAPFIPHRVASNPDLSGQRGSAL